MRLVVIGAHAMDAELMAGCLAASAVDAGWEVSLVHLTLGERGHPHKSAMTFAAQLREEAASAARHLGCTLVPTELPAPLDPGAARSMLGGLLTDLEPDFVMTHWVGSWHPSHRAAHDATIEALSRTNSAVGIVYGENCEDLDGFRATHVIDASATRERYLEAAGSYELFRRSIPGGAVEPPIPYWAYYTSALRVRGQHVGLGAAQALMCPDRTPPALPGMVPFRVPATPAGA